jgi:hypothetical protein
MIRDGNGLDYWAENYKTPFMILIYSGHDKRKAAF